VVQQQQPQNQLGHVALQTAAIERANQQTSAEPGSDSDEKDAFDPDGI